MSKKLYQITCFALFVLLIASNVWWAYSAANAATVNKYQGQAVYERGSALRQALSMLPPLARGSTEHDVRVVSHELGEDSFEKHGVLWVGWLGFSFDTSGRIQNVQPNFDLPDESTNESE